MRDSTLQIKWKILVLTLVGCFLFFLKTDAQTRVVTGTVIDAGTNETIIGATVKVKGTNQGVSTDANGKFRLKAAPSAVLQISSVGYTTTEVKAYFNKPMQIKIASSNSELNEVVVVGYGTQKKATLTGSVATVSAKSRAYDCLTDYGAGTPISCTT